MQEVEFPSWFLLAGLVSCSRLKVKPRGKTKARVVVQWRGSVLVEQASFRQLGLVRGHNPVVCKRSDFILFLFYFISGNGLIKS